MMAIITMMKTTSEIEKVVKWYDLGIGNRQPAPPLTHWQRYITYVLHRSFAFGEYSRGGRDDCLPNWQRFCHVHRAIFKYIFYDSPTSLTINYAHIFFFFCTKNVWIFEFLQCKMHGSMTHVEWKSILSLSFSRRRDVFLFFVIFLCRHVVVNWRLERTHVHFS